jgi:hypothetical protein
MAGMVLQVGKPPLFPIPLPLPEFIQKGTCVPFCHPALPYSTQIVKAEGDFFNRHFTSSSSTPPPLRLTPWHLPGLS